MWSSQEDTATRPQQFLEHKTLLCCPPDVFEHRAAEADIKVRLGERQCLPRLNAHKARPREDRLEGATVLDRGHSNVPAVRIPALQKIRVGETGIRCHPQI